MKQWTEIVPAEPGRYAHSLGMRWIVKSQGSPPTGLYPWLSRMVGRYDWDIYGDGVGFRNLEDAQLFYLAWADS